MYVREDAWEFQGLQLANVEQVWRGWGESAGGADLPKQLVIFSISIPTVFLRKPGGKVANGSHMIVGRFATSGKCEWVA